MKLAGFACPVLYTGKLPVSHHSQIFLRYKPLTPCLCRSTSFSSFSWKCGESLLFFHGLQDIDKCLSLQIHPPMEANIIVDRHDFWVRILTQLHLGWRSKCTFTCISIWHLHISFCKIISIHANMGAFPYRRFLVFAPWHHVHVVCNCMQPN